MTNPGSQHPFRRTTITRGRLIRLEPGDTGQPELEFQYNPETVTRTRTGRWDPRKRRRDPKAIETPQQHRQSGASGASALMAESETISLQLVFDATEAVLRDPSGPEATSGVLAPLAFLELASLGRDPQDRAASGGSGKPKTNDIRPIRPDELLLELGESRWFPCVLTDLTITEQRFSPALVPMRARADLKLTVLEPVENASNRLVKPVFDQLLKRRQDLAATLGAGSSSSTLQKLLGGGG